MNWHRTTVECALRLRISNHSEAHRIVNLIVVIEWNMTSSVVQQCCLHVVISNNSNSANKCCSTHTDAYDAPFDFQAKKGKTRINHFITQRCWYDLIIYLLVMLTSILIIIFCQLANMSNEPRAYVWRKISFLWVVLHNFVPVFFSPLTEIMLSCLCVLDCCTFVWIVWTQKPLVELHIIMATIECIILVLHHIRRSSTGNWMSHKSK